jgi:hypothetical protein
MVMFTDMIPIVEKYWRNYENYTVELKEACLAFGNFTIFKRKNSSSPFGIFVKISSLLYKDRKDMGIMEFEDLKNVLMKYGEQMDEDEIKLFEKSVNVSDGKIIVDGKSRMRRAQLSN